MKGLIHCGVMKSLIQVNYLYHVDIVVLQTKNLKAPLLNDRGVTG